MSCVGSLPKLWVNIHGRRLLALLDSGATHSFIRPEHTTQVPTKPVQMFVRLANASQSTCTIGCVETTIQFSGCETPATLYILDGMTEDVILGQEWLKEEQAVMDFPRSCVHVGKVQRHTLFWTTSGNQKRHVLAVTPQPEQLPVSHVAEYQHLLNQFGDVFDETLHQPTTKLAEHDIRLKDDTPFKIRRYQYSTAKKAVIAEEVKNMLAAGVIRRSHGRYCSPIVIVDKKDGRPRFCVDYRQLNSQTFEEVSQLPPIRETIRELGAAKIFTSLDLKSGYWQVPMSERSIPLTAFSTPDGATYEFLVMPFGLRNAPSTFQKMMTEVLADYVDVFVKVYLDDIIVYSENHEDHLRHLALVMERLRIHALHCGLNKCRFGAEELDYLGYRITARENRPQEKHVIQIRDYPTPKSKKELQTFLGTANWLREFVPEFATITAPLTDLTGQQRFQWTQEAADAFERVKAELSKPLALCRPQPGIPYVLQTDASSIGMGAVLFQRTESGERRVISCSSAKFTGSEKRYHINEQETLAVVWACKRYRHWLENEHFTLITDSRALTWLHQFKDERAKLTRWALQLQEYNFTVEHCPGKLNQLPDFLSRFPDEPMPESTGDDARLLPPEPPKAAKQTPTTEAALGLLDGETADLPPDLFEQIKAAQLTDQSTVENVTHWKNLQGAEWRLKPWERRLKEQFEVEDGYLWHINPERRALVVPKAMWPRVVHFYHDSLSAGHPGRDETFRAIDRLYHWTALRGHVSSHVRLCLVCASTKRGALQTSAPLRPRPPTRPWQVVSLDVMGPYAITSSKNRFMLVLTDTCSRWIEVEASPTADTTRLKAFLDRVCHRWGYPEAIITDNAPAFKARAWVGHLKKSGIQHYTSPIYHQRANPVERRNQELKKAMRERLRCVAADKWDTVISQVVYTLHNRANAATGYTPSELLFGTSLPRPGEWKHPEQRNPLPEARQAAKERQAKARQNQTLFQRKQYPEPRKATVKLTPNQLVMTRKFKENRPSFGPTWEGPHHVVAVLGDNTYEIEKNGGIVPIHIDDLRPMPERRRPPEAVRDGAASPAGDDSDAAVEEDPPSSKIP